MPNWYSYVCNQHFVSKKMSNDHLNIDFIPSIFPPVYKKNSVNSNMALARHKRFKNRLNKPKNSTPLSSVSNENSAVGEIVHSSAIQFADTLTEASGGQKVHKGCQVTIFSDNVSLKSTHNFFVCSRFEKLNGICDAETQCDLSDNNITKVNRKQYADKKSENHVIFVDKSVNTGENYNSKTSFEKDSFKGYLSIKNDDQLTDIARVTRETFKILLNRLKIFKTRKVTIEDRLLIFLFKLKTGLTYSVIAVIFCVTITRVTDIFITTLETLRVAMAGDIYWMAKDASKLIRPKCFDAYPNVRAIIDCTEFRTEIPKGIGNRVFMYSHYKKGFTAKVLIAIDPCGFISLVSEASGGRKSDTQISIESKLIDILEDGDVVLADKGFPEFKTKLEEEGKKVTFIMPPFLEDKSHFTREETEETYKVASVRIHVERVMQRLRLYNTGCPASGSRYGF